MMEELTLRQLKTELNKLRLVDREGLIFCIGTSFISRLIQVKTRENSKEIVPSHIAMVKGKFLYESTSAEEKVGYKTIPAGVRRYLLDDFFKAEKTKNTTYYFFPTLLDDDELEKYIHLPYGKDIILDYLLKDGSDGSSKGLICSQYANKVAKMISKECVNPAELMREAIRMEEQESETDL